MLWKGRLPVDTTVLRSFICASSLIPAGTAAFHGGVVEVNSSTISPLVYDGNSDKTDLNGSIFRQKLEDKLGVETTLRPVPVISWDKRERIMRYEEIWSEKNSVVHRLPEHYKQRFWESILSDRTPVHYRKPEERYSWDEKKSIWIENQNYPILPIYPPEADEGLWGGEGVVKGYRISRPFTRKKILPRQRVPHLWWPNLKKRIRYSEILDRYMSIVMTERTLRLIDKNFGFDFYILRTPEIDLCSKLGNKLKREMLCELAKGLPEIMDPCKRQTLLKRYGGLIIPLEEAEWVGLDLNEACIKLQDLEEANRAKERPLKEVYEEEVVKELEKEGEDKSSVSWTEKIMNRFRFI